MGLQDSTLQTQRFRSHEISHPDPAPSTNFYRLLHREKRSLTEMLVITSDHTSAKLKCIDDKITLKKSWNVCSIGKLKEAVKHWKPSTSATHTNVSIYFFVSLAQETSWDISQLGDGSFSIGVICRWLVSRSSGCTWFWLQNPLSGIISCVVGPAGAAEAALEAWYCSISSFWLMA